MCLLQTGVDMFHSQGGRSFQFIHGGPGTLPPGFKFIQGGGMAIPKPGGKRGSPKEKEYYDLLGVSPSATTNEITKAFRKIARDKHPDKGGDVEIYKKFSSAYDILSNEELRHCYDAYGKNFDQIPNLEMFKQQLKNADVTVPLEVTLKECINGKECKIHYGRLSSRGTPEKMMHQFYLPPGSMNNQKFTFNNLGHCESSKLPGNLVVVVQESEQKDFKRYGNALLHTFNVNLEDVLSGKPVAIEHPRGNTIHVHSTESFQTDTWYKLDGQGCTNTSPMFFQIKVKFPELTMEKRQEILKVLKGQDYESSEIEKFISAEEIDVSDMETEIRQQRQNQHEASEQSFGQPNCPIQ